MRLLTRLAVVFCLSATTTLVIQAPAAFAGTGCTVCVVQVTNPGTNPTKTTGAPDPCTYSQGTYLGNGLTGAAATDPAYIAWLASQKNGQGGYLVNISCPGQAPTVVFVPPTTATAGQMAQQARAAITLTYPTATWGPNATASDGTKYTVVRGRTWFWTDPSTFKVLTSTKTSPGGLATATVTATPTALTFTPGDGGADASCSGPGTPWVLGTNTVWQLSPSNCDYGYAKSRASASAQIHILWNVTWSGWSAVGGNESGSYGQSVTSTPVSFAVYQGQAVVVQ